MKRVIMILLLPISAPGFAGVSLAADEAPSDPPWNDPAIATLKLPHRPDRIEPRAKKRRPKNLPLLTVPRQLARDVILAQRKLNRVT